MTGVVIKIPWRIWRARYINQKVEAAIKLKGLTDFHLNQISASLFQFRHWMTLNEAEKKSLIALIENDSFRFEKPAPDYPDEPA